MISDNAPLGFIYNHPSQCQTFTGSYIYPTVKKKVLVLGAAGLIGNAVCKHLKETETYEVFRYDLKIRKPEYPCQPYYAVIDCGRYDKPSEQFLLWNAVIEQFKKKDTGRLILFSSIYGHKAPDFGIYDGTEIKEPPVEYAIWKGGTEQATRYLAQKLKPWRIQVNCIAPGGVLDNHSETFQEEYHTSGFARMIEVKNLMPVIDALLHEDNAINGQIITVDNGWTL